MRHAVEHAATDLAASVRIPGFRKGKVPMPVLVTRVGKERISPRRSRATSAAGSGRGRAATRIRPGRAPEYDYELPDLRTRQTVSFTATVAVQPKPELADWTTLEVPARRCRGARGARRRRARAAQRDASPSSRRSRADPRRRATRSSSTSSASGGEAQRDFVVELGARPAGRGARARRSSACPPARSSEIDVRARRRRTAQPVTVTRQGDQGEGAAAARRRARARASEFDTLAELRADIEERLREQLEAEIETEFRAAAVDALVEASNVERGAARSSTRARTELLHGLVQSLERRGIDVETYCRLTGQTPRAAAGAHARRGARVGRTRARARGRRRQARDRRSRTTRCEASSASRPRPRDDGCRRDGRSSGHARDGRAEQLREDLRLRKALDRVAAEVKRIPRRARATPARSSGRPEQGEARPAETKLWTPGSKEPA